MENTEDVIERCAHIAHETNRAYCSALGDHTQPEWHDAPEWQKESARAGARAVIDELAPPDPALSHAGWMERKVAEGWSYGLAKDPKAKTHHCLRPFAELPVEQRAKDHLFVTIVWHVAKALRN